MDEQEQRAALAEALQHDGRPPVVDCCLGSQYRDLYPNDWKERHHRQHEAHATAILDILQAAGLGIAPISVIETGEAVERLDAIAAATPRAGRAGDGR